MLKVQYIFKAIVNNFIKAVLIFITITALSFYIIDAFSPDTSQILAGNNPSYNEIDKIHKDLGRNHSFLYNFKLYFKNAVRLDFGKSSETHKEILEIFKNTIVVSLAINIPGFFLSFFISLFIALQITYLNNAFLNRLASFLSTLSLSMNHIVIVIMMQIIFCSSDALNLFPVQGWKLDSFKNYLKFSSIPILCIVLTTIGYNIRFFSNVLREEYKKHYYITAKAFGMSKHRVLYKYLLKNCFSTIFTYTIYALPFYFLGGFIILERIFNIPGLGFVSFRAITIGDISILKFLIFLSSCIYTFITFFSDIICHLLDPRQN